MRDDDIRALQRQLDAERAAQLAAEENLREEQEARASDQREIDRARRRQLVTRIDIAAFVVLTLLRTVLWHYGLGDALGADARRRGWLVGFFICLVLGVFITAPASEMIGQSIASRLERRARARGRDREADRLGGWAAGRPERTPA